MKFTPHIYERKGIEFIIGQATAGLLWKPGRGKTVTVETAIDMLIRAGYNKRALVVAPLRVCHSVWPVEAQKWDHLARLRVGVLANPTADKRLAALREVKKHDISVINPESLEWLVRTVAQLKMPWPWDILVIDESTKFKKHDTQRHRTIKSILNNFKRRYILTGSPAPNGLIDLWGQIYVLDGGAALGKYISHYRSAYFDNPDRQGWGWVARRGAEEVIYEKIRPLVMHLGDDPDLPPLIENIVPVELPPAAMKEYRHMEDALVAILEDETITAANASVAWGKCRQLANGGIFHEDGEKWTHVHEAKVDAVEDIVEELQGKPCLVAYEYQHDLERLQKKLKLYAVHLPSDDPKLPPPEVPWIGGGVSAKRFKEIEGAWNRGEIPVLLAQPQSVAHGLNLQSTPADVIDAGLTPDLEVDEQFVRRVWRQGQKERVVRHRIVAKGTVDEAIIRMLSKKDRTQRALLDALKTTLKERRAA